MELPVMTDLDQALVDIRSIRRQVARTAEFRGYGPLTLSSTAVVALLAGAAQSYWVPEPLGHPAAYVVLWLSAAVLCAALIATQMLTRAHRMHSDMADEMIRAAVAQFLPAAIAGAVLPFVLLRFAEPQAFRLLPGLWQILFSLGVFASCRGMSRLLLIAGAWFMLTGFLCLALGDARSLMPTAMVVPYAVGMIFIAAVHFYSARRESINDEV